MAEELQRHGIKFSLDLNKHPKDAINLSLINAENFKVSEDGSTLISDKTLEENTVIKDKLSEYYGDNPYNIIFCIPTNDEIVLFVTSNYVTNKYYDLDLFRYSEKLDECSNSIIPSEYEKMKYYGGKFSGTFTYNAKNELIITFCEYDSFYPTYLNYGEPLKTINLGYFDIDKEGNYYLNISSNLNPKTFPICPEVDIPSINNWSIINGLSKKGWYHFYIRYKINKYDYTQWFSFGRAFYLDEDENKIIFKYLNSGNTHWELKSTISDSVDFCNKTISFKLNNLSTIYEEYQLGFTCSTKTYIESKITDNIKISDNSFILNYKDAKNYDYNNFLKTYENYYSVKNIINYNNRLYISNYKTSKKINIINNLNGYLKTIDVDNITTADTENKKTIIISFNGERKTIELIDNKITAAKLFGVNNLYTYRNKENNVKEVEGTTTEDERLFYHDAYSRFLNQTAYLINNDNGLYNAPINRVTGCSGWGGWTFEWYHTIEKNSTIMTGEFAKVIEEHWIQYYTINYVTYNGIENLSNYEFEYNPDLNTFKCNELTKEIYSLGIILHSENKVTNKGYTYYNSDVEEYPNIKPEYEVLESDYYVDDANYKFSLIPKQPYNFFIHYIDKYGYVNDGLPINSNTADHYRGILKFNNDLYLRYTTCLFQQNDRNKLTDFDLYLNENYFPDAGANLRLEHIKNALFKIYSINGDISERHAIKTYNQIENILITLDDGNKTYIPDAILNHADIKPKSFIRNFIYSDEFKDYTLKEKLYVSLYHLYAINGELNFVALDNNAIYVSLHDIEDTLGRYIEFQGVSIPQDYKSYFISYEKLYKTLLYNGVAEINISEPNKCLFYSDSLNYDDTINIDANVDNKDNKIINIKYNVADSIQDGNEGKSTNLEIKFENEITNEVMSLYRYPTRMYENFNKTLLRISEVSTNPYINIFTYGFKNKAAPIIIKDKFRINNQNKLIKYDSSDLLTSTPFKNINERIQYSYVPDNYKQINNPPKIYKTITNEVNYDNPKAEFYNSYLFLPQDTIDLFKNNALDYDESCLSIYSNYNEDNINQTEFIKTIRRSTFIKDESLENGWRSFESEAYQNIQENKGEIMRIEGIGDLLLVHTKDSLFQFDKSNLLMTTNKNVQLAQGDTFDVGYKEIFTSPNGYGGLQDKEAAIVGEFGYIWYNNDFNKIYQYNAGSLNVISGNIEFLLNRYKPSTCRFVDDKQNKRLIIQFQLNIGVVDGLEKIQILNLTYNYDIKAFISFYKDYTLFPDMINETYNTKTKFYILESDKAFSGFSKCNATKLSFIINENYSKIKRLNFIKYKMYKRIDSSNDKFDANLPVEGNAMSLATGATPYSGFQLRVYNDLCDTGILDIHHDVKIGTSDKTKPYYDLGNFTFNYLRDKDNNNQIFGNFFIVEFIFEPTTDQEDGVIEFESLEYSVSYEEN